MVNAVINALTAAEWELGMPPVETANRKEARRVLEKNAMGILINYAKIIANIDATKGKLAITNMIMPPRKIHVIH